MMKDAGDIHQKCLTPLENAVIIAALYAAEAKEKKLALLVVRFQLSVALVVALIAYNLYGAPQFALSVLSGGLVSTVNGALLAWRMSRTVLHTDQDVQSSQDAHHQLRLLYFYAAERFLFVIALLGFCMTALKLSPLAVLGGFVMGQATLLAAQFLLSRIKFEY